MIVIRVSRNDVLHRPSTARKQSSKVASRSRHATSWGAQAPKVHRLKKFQRGNNIHIWVLTARTRCSKQVNQVNWLLQGGYILGGDIIRLTARYALLYSYSNGSSRKKLVSVEDAPSALHHYAPKGR